GESTARNAEQRIRRKNTTALLRRIPKAPLLIFVLRTRTCEWAAFPKRLPQRRRSWRSTRDTKKHTTYWRQRWGEWARPTKAKKSSRAIGNSKHKREPK